MVVEHAQPPDIISIAIASALVSSNTKSNVKSFGITYNQIKVNIEY